MAGFLDSVARSGLCYAQSALGAPDAAQALTRRTLLTLARRHAHAPPSDLPLLLLARLQRDIARIRRRRALRHTLRGLRPRRNEDETPHPLETLDAHAALAATNPDAWLALPAVRTLLEQALSLLPPAQGDAWRLRHVLGLPGADAAVVLRVPYPLLRRRLHAARHTLALLLQHKGVLPVPGHDALGAALRHDAALSATWRDEVLGAHARAPAATLPARLSPWLLRHCTALRAGLCALLLAAGLALLPWHAARERAADDAALLAGPLSPAQLLSPQLEEALR